MTPQELRASILQQAIQGKLVEQRPEEGTGEELFQNIQAEKQAMIKAGKIKKEKPLPEIVEDQIPFDIPDTWKWIHLNSAISLLSGSDLQPSKYNAVSKGIPYITGASNIENHQLLINRWTEHPNNIAYKGDLLLTCKGTVGKTIILQEAEVHIARQLMAITPILIDTRYTQFFVECQVESLKAKAKSMIPGIERDNVLKLLLPLPPLAEQKRIVTKLEEILPLIDRYEAAWNKLEEFNKRFPGDMRKSLIQLAIQGKLVKQCDFDEKIDDVLSSIKHKRAELIKSKKLKEPGKINKRSEVELDIPDTWRFVCLNELICKRVDNRGKTPPHSLIKTEQHYIDLLEINAIIPDASVNHDNVEKYLDEATYSSLRGFIEEGDILIATVGSVGKFAMMDNSRSAIAQNIIGIKCFEEIEQKYIFYLLQSPYFYASMGNITMEAVQASIKVPDLMNLRVPLPPPAEQKRIVAKLEEILPLCDRLK